jgi:hypothetical protein
MSMKTDETIPMVVDDTYIVEGMKVAEYYYYRYKADMI